MSGHGAEEEQQEQPDVAYAVDQGNEAGFGGCYKMGENGGHGQQQDDGSQAVAGCNKYILEGAALCKKIGSPAYDTWIEAMVRLNDTYIGSKPYNAVDLIDKAYSRTWETCAVGFT